MRQPDRRSTTTRSKGTPIMTCSAQRSFLLGSNQLQLELLSLFISERCHISCTVAHALEEIPCCQQSPQLILYDYRCWKEDLRGARAARLKSHLGANLVVLTNVTHDTGIENEALGH